MLGLQNYIQTRNHTYQYVIAKLAGYLNVLNFDFGFCHTHIPSPIREFGRHDYTYAVLLSARFYLHWCFVLPQSMFSCGGVAYW